MKSSGASQSPYKVRDHQPDEANSATDRCGSTRGQCRKGEDQQSSLNNGDTNRQSLFFSEQKSVHAAVQKDHTQNSHRNRWSGQPDMFPRLIADAADQPEQQFLNPVLIADDHYQSYPRNSNASDRNPG
jgi:hypothetical protein